MASNQHFLATNHACNVFTRLLVVPLQNNSFKIAKRNCFRFATSLKCINGDQNIMRRSGNYQPTIWKYDYIQSIKSDYSGNVYAEKAVKLKEYVKQRLAEFNDPLKKIELIDDLERLGIAHHFEHEIEIILNELYNNDNINMWNKEDLFATSLRFRLFRQHGYKCPLAVFNKFKDEEGNFKACICKDTKGLLYLYEATFVSIKGESLLREARELSTKYLKEGLEKNAIEADLAVLVSHSLELPLHWRIPRLEARWFIDVYEKRSDMNQLILQFAMLDFNIVQAIHQEDIKQMSRWWKSTGLGEKLRFARDGLIECYLWAMGVNFEPPFEYCRRMGTKLYVLATIIDDIYDVYGTLEELELFTSAVERWDLSAIDQLPDYMKLCYFTLFNSTNEMAFDTLKEDGLLIISYLKKAWVDLCKMFLLEAKWYHSGYKPTLDEYMDNAWISIGAAVILVHGYVFLTKPLKRENLEFLEKYHNIIKWSARIVWLSDDLGTSSDELKRGDVMKSVQCYMHETGASEEDARKHINHLIDETWMNINEHLVVEESPLISKTFTKTAMNLGRMAQCIYQFGDGHASQDVNSQNRVSSLIINPVNFKKRFV